jgi:hypothetical protein
MRLLVNAVDSEMTFIFIEINTIYGGYKLRDMYKFSKYICRTKFITYILTNISNRDMPKLTAMCKTQT